MVKTFERIKVSRDVFDYIIEKTKKEFGSCCRDTIFKALNYTIKDSDKAKFIRKTALSCGGKKIKEEKIV